MRPTCIAIVVGIDKRSYVRCAAREARHVSVDKGQQVPVRVSISADFIDVEPGRATEIPITVHSTSAIVDAYDLSVLGVPGEWVRIEPRAVSVFPGEDATATIVVSPPRDQTVVAGTRRIGIHA